MLRRIEQCQEELSRLTDRYRLIRVVGVSSSTTFSFFAVDLRPEPGRPDDPPEQLASEGGGGRYVQVHRVSVASDSLEKLNEWRILTHISGVDPCCLRVYDVIVPTAIAEEENHRSRRSRRKAQPSGAAAAAVDPPSPVQGLNYFFCVTEHVPHALSDVLRSQTVVFTEDHRRYFLYQLLRIVFILHQAGLVHGNLRPSLFRLYSSCDLRLSSMEGSFATTASDNSDDTQYAVVRNRYHQSPELLGDFHDEVPPAHLVSPAMDVWSLGCIFAEFIQRKPLLTGRSGPDQLHLIIEQLGTPSREVLDATVRRVEVRRFIDKLPRSDAVPWSTVFASHEPHADALDLIGRMLKWNPAERITVLEAMRHPYFTGLHTPADEIAHVGPFVVRAGTVGLPPSLTVAGPTDDDDASEAVDPVHEDLVQLWRQFELRALMQTRS